MQALPCFQTARSSQTRCPLCWLPLERTGPLTRGRFKPCRLVWTPPALTAPWPSLAAPAPRPSTALPALSAHEHEILKGDIKDDSRFPQHA